MAEQYALSEARKDEWKIAADLLKNPYIGPDPVEPDTPEDEEARLSSDAAISIPWLREVPEAGRFGFPEVYWPAHCFGGC